MLQTKVLLGSRRSKMSINQVSFTGIGAKGASFAKSYAETNKYTANKELQKEVEAYLPKPIQIINKMKSLVGEVPNIIINALGTGLIAPFFIKYNFLSKADDETRTYSALRQPISAVLAVVTQAGLLIPLNSLMDRMSNSGEFSTKYNKTGFQDTSHIEKLVKINHPEMSKKQISELAKNIQLEQLEPLINNVKKNNTIQYLRDGKQVSIPEKEFSTLLKETVDDMHKHLATNLKRYETEKLTKQIQRGDYLRVEKAKVQPILNTILEKIEKTKTHEEFNNWMKAQIKTLKANKADSELINIITEISQRPDLTTIKAKTLDVNRKCVGFAKCKNKEEVAKRIETKVNRAISKMQSDMAVIEEMQQTIEKAAKPNASALEKLAASAKKLDLKAKTISNKDFVYKVVDKHIKKVNGNVKGLKQMIGLGVSLAILPATCSLLNYIYPKFMDVVFPELAQTKHSKEKEKLIKGCDHSAPKQEVSK